MHCQGQGKVHQYQLLRTLAQWISLTPVGSLTCHPPHALLESPSHFFQVDHKCKTISCLLPRCLLSFPSGNRGHNHPTSPSTHQPPVEGAPRHLSPPETSSICTPFIVASLSGPAVLPFLQEYTYRMKCFGP